MKNYLYGLITLAAGMLFALTGCQKEPTGGLTHGKNTLTIVLGGDDALTKAGTQQVATYKFEGTSESDDDALMLVETVSSMDEMFFAEQMETKGTPIYTETFDQKYGTKLYGTAFDPTGVSGEFSNVWGSYLENGGTVNFKKDPSADNTYYYDYSAGETANLHWPENGKLYYFFQAPGDVTRSFGAKFYSNGKIEFDYTDPNTPVNNVIANGATKQTDILFTSKVINKPAEGLASSKILMYHALTAVKFKIGNVDPIGTETKITKVTLNGITANGHCTIDPYYKTSDHSSHSNENGDDVTKSAVCSTWGAHKTDEPLKVSYSQTFTGETTYFGSGYHSNGPQSQDLRNLTSTTDGSDILLLIPQVLKDNVITIEYTVNDVPYSRSAKLSSTWKAGEIHTYTLTVNQVAVDVTDKVDETTKSDVVTTNTGNVTAYLRAAVVAGWYYTSKSGVNTLVEPYDMTGDDTKFSKSDNWFTVDGDDYYYYRYPILPGQATAQSLFKEDYTKVVNNKFPGAHLEIAILLQGVQFDADGSKARVKSAWGETVANKLETTPEGSTNK